MPLDSAVDVALDKGLTGEGALTLQAPRIFSFRTYGPLRLSDFRCPRTTGPRCQAHRDFTILLSNPVAPAEFDAHFKVPGLPRRKPSPPQLTHGPQRLQPPAREQLVRADPDFGKRYHAVLTAGMHDDFGQTLEHDVAFDIDVEAPFTRNGQAVTSVKPAPPSRREGDGDQTADNQAESAPSDGPDPSRPHRQELDYSVKFGMSGDVFEALAKTGVRSHKVPVASVNIPTYALAAAKIRKEDVLSWIARASGSGAPAFPWTWVTPGASENVRDVRTVDLDGLLGGPQARGAAVLAVAMPGSMQSPEAHVVSVTDLAISGRLSRYGGVVWVTHLSTGAPVPDATVSIEKPGKPTVFSSTTNADGMVVISAEQWNPLREGGTIDTNTFFVVRAGDDWTFQRIAQAAASFRAGVDIDLAQRGQWAGMLYTDRGVYRPGEALKLSGVFRKVDAEGLKVVNTDARVAFEDAQGEKVFDGRAELDPFGELNLEVPLPKTSHLGEGRIAVQIGREPGDRFEQSILVAAYKASEFKVEALPDKKEYVRGDRATFDVHAEYLFGAPMGSAPVHNHVTRSLAYFTPPHSEGYVVTDEADAVDHPETNANASELRVEDGHLDEDGRARATLSMDLPRMRGPESVLFEAEVEDVTNQTVAQRASVLVHPAAFYVGLGRLRTSFVAVGADVDAKVAAIRAVGEPRRRRARGGGARPAHLDDGRRGQRRAGAAPPFPRGRYGGRDLRRRDDAERRRGGALQAARGPARLLHRPRARQGRRGQPGRREHELLLRRRLRRRDGLQRRVGRPGQPRPEARGGQEALRRRRRRPGARAKPLQGGRSAHHRRASGRALEPRRDAQGADARRRRCPIEADVFSQRVRGGAPRARPRPSPARLGSGYRRARVPPRRRCLSTSTPRRTASTWPSRRTRRSSAPARTSTPMSSSRPRTVMPRARR